MERLAQPEEFLLLGGPLHRLGGRFGLAHASNTTSLGLALGGSAWLVLVLLALVEGLAAQVFSLSAVGAHVRLLIAVPLLFVCEAMLAPRLAEFVKTVVRARVVPAGAVPALNTEIARIRSVADAWWPDILCMLLALLMLAGGSHLHLYGASAGQVLTAVDLQATLTGRWYDVVCLTLVRFLLLRWLFRLVLWSHFLWRLRRLDLELVPTHPDRLGGLGGLQVVHAQFVFLAMAVSAIQAAAFAEEVTIGTMLISEVPAAIVLLIATLAVMLLGPLLILAPRLWEARVAGLAQYSVMASHYVSAFDRKWLHVEGSPVEPLLGTPDLQSLADLQNSVGAIEEMRWIPISGRLATQILVAILVPLAPLLMLRYPVVELLDKLLGRLVGI